MIVSCELKESYFLDRDTFMIITETVENQNENGELYYSQIEAELHLDTRDEWIGISTWDVVGDFIESIDAREELSEDELKTILTMLYNEYNKANKQFD